jgi:hypothetical protein
VIGKCKLCGNESNLILSHIVPSFVFKWLKENSATGYLRFANTPNLRVQDGIKEYWLCNVCEGLFNKWETEYANKIFRPIAEAKSHEFR